MDLANLQLTSDAYKDDDPLHNHVDNLFFAARTIADSTSLQLLSYCYNQAFRLAEGQLFLASSDAVQYYPKFSILATSWLLKYPVNEEGLDVYITGGVNYFGLRQRMFTDMQDSVRALIMAAAHFIPLTRHLDSKCTIHPSDALPPHEIARFLSAWYWFKLYVLSYHPQGDGLRRTLAAELKSMNYLQITVYLRILIFLHNDLDEVEASKFGIMDMDYDLEYETCVPADWWESRKEWTDLWHNIATRHAELKMMANDLQPMLQGCSDVCHGQGNCKPRDKDKGIWEI